MFWSIPITAIKEQDKIRFVAICYDVIRSDAMVTIVPPIVVIVAKFLAAKNFSTISPINTIDIKMWCDLIRLDTIVPIGPRWRPRYQSWSNRGKCESCIRHNFRKNWKQDESSLTLCQMTEKPVPNISGISQMVKSFTPSDHVTLSYMTIAGYFRTGRVIQTIKDNNTQRSGTWVCDSSL